MSGKEKLSTIDGIALGPLPDCTGISATTVLMHKPGPLSPLAGHALIAAALGLSLIVMLPLVALPAARLLGWLTGH